MSNFMVSKLVVKSYLYRSVETFIDLKRRGNLVVGVYECPAKDNTFFTKELFYLRQMQGKNVS